MCGINVIVGLNDQVASKNKIEAMNKALKHRGPDDEGVFVDSNIALGHRRLSIIDLSAAGHQPMFSYDNRYLIVYNGELYNYLEIKNQLKSDENTYQFKTNTDTEVILASFIKWGKDCVKQFNGMFAFAIWDNIKKELFVARDRIGVKPLYYSSKNGTIVFSSEIRALLASDLIERKVDSVALVDYMRYQTVHAPDTIIKDVKMLMPGHSMIINNEGIKIDRYWSLAGNISYESANKSYDEICKDVNQLLLKAVERRLISDVSFGAFLSGGIDSSAVVGLMSNVIAGKVKTFSIGFDEAEFSELEYARLIAKKFNTDHHEIILKPTDFLSQLDFALKSMDFPSGDGLNTYVVSKLTKQSGITMALSGLGGDELFAGYDLFKQLLSLKNKSWLNNIPHVFRKIGADTLKSLKKDVATEKIAAILKCKKIDFDSYFPIFRQSLMDDRILKLLNIQQLPSNRMRGIISENKFSEHQSSISSISNSMIATYLESILLRDSDQMSMAHALEIRVPFMDYKLVEYVLGVPDKHKYPSIPKKLLVDSLGNLLPDEIIYRPKMGFVFPWKMWLKNELRTFCEQKIKSLSQREIFNEKEVLKFWKDFLNDHPQVGWSRIWYLVVLENWLNENKIDNN